MDENGILIDDPEHSDLEDRFVLLGLSFQNAAYSRRWKA